jgi:putative NADH-flavin reductase
MRLAIFGGTGGTGRCLIEQALERGDTVTALVRQPDALGELGAKIHVVAGDVLDPGDVAATVSGAEVVFSALGIGMHRHATVVYSHGTTNVLDAMRAEGVRRLMVVSTSSLEIPAPTRFAEWLLSQFLHRLLSKPYADMALMEQRVRESAADWTLLRAARLTNGRRTGGVYRTATNGRLGGCWSISRADVADYLLRHATDESTYRGTVDIAY